MNKDRLIRLIKDKNAALTMDDKVALEKLTTQYPWFSTAYMLQARSMIAEDYILYTENLPLYSCYGGNRAVMYEYLHSVESNGGTSESESGRAKESESERLASEARVGAEERELFVKTQAAAKTVSSSSEQCEENPLVNRHLSLTVQQYSFTQWLSLLETDAHANKERKETDWLIDKFIIEEPRIKPQPAKFFKAEDVAEASGHIDLNLATETLADIYLRQGLAEKAIEIFQVLGLRYPEKSRYFAERIDGAKK